MVKPHQSLLAEAQVAFSKNLEAALKMKDKSARALSTELTKAGASVSQKTISNILNGEHPNQLDKLAAVAHQIGVPLWVMFIPDLPPELVGQPHLGRLVRLVEDYLACNGERSHIENFASALCVKAKRTNSQS